MEKQLKKELYNLCDPYRISYPIDVNINIDEFYDDHTLLRGFNWAEKLFDHIDFGEGDTFQLFTGYSGSGKTTELKRVQKMAEDENYLVVYINSDDYIDMNSEVGISDIYNSIIYSTVIEVNKLDDIGAVFTDEGYFERLKNFMKSEVNISEVNIQDVVLEMKGTPTLRQQVRQHIEDNFSKYQKDIKQDLAKLNEKVKNKGKTGILIILDSLEKNKGITSNYDEVIKASEVIFSNRDNLSMPLDIIYTVPTYLSERVRLNHIDFLPAIKVKDKNGDPYEKGLEALRMLVSSRVSEDNQKEIFGDDYKNQVDKIIKFSGGYVRELLEILRMAIIQKNYPVKSEIVDKLIQNEKNSFKELVNSDIVKELKEVHEKKEISHISDISIKDQLLTNHLILRYRNSDLWFDLHPALEEFTK
ncbi:MAG: hypothetical protein U9Q33_05785 [Campylobacterota bacterium]|nr:hypothetical protein [Campylobacterota bacterium]